MNLTPIPAPHLYACPDYIFADGDMYCVRHARSTYAPDLDADTFDALIFAGDLTDHAGNPLSPVIDTTEIDHGRWCAACEELT
jgi:hypothetical protein